MLASMRGITHTHSRGITFTAALVILLVASAIGACGGSTPGAEEPESEYDDTEDMVGESEPAGGQSDETEGSEAEGGGEKAAAAEPEFKDGMSVDDAINAVPQGTPRVNIDTDRLSEPLRKPELYEPCKLAAAQHFSVRVAVWNGKAVGIDIDTKPPNQRVAECIDKQIRETTWDDKVKSLNTVEYSF
jgi:hypothetical protein